MPRHNVVCMLIYLDSGDLANLERLRWQAPTALKQFIREWSDLDCTLALTLHHAQEVAQLSDDTSRKRRIELIQQFPRIRYEQGGSHRVFQLETLAQLRARVVKTVPDYESMVSPKLFAEETAQGLEVTVVELGESLRMMEGAQQLTASARNSSRGLATPRSFRRLTREMVDAQSARAQMNATPQSPEYTPEVRSMMRSIFTGLLEHFDSSPNMRMAMEKFYGIHECECIREVDDDDLARVATFFLVARDSIPLYIESFGGSEDVIRSAVRTLDPYDCPGSRIEMAISRAQDASNQTAAVSDEPDRAHMAFLPYVDVAFADRRTVGFFEQQARSAKRSEVLRLHSRKLCRSGPVHSILKEIRRLAPDAS